MGQKQRLGWASVSFGMALRWLGVGRWWARCQPRVGADGRRLADGWPLVGLASARSRSSHTLPVNTADKRDMKAIKALEGKPLV